MDIDTSALDAKIQLLKNTAEELKAMGDNFPAVARNTARVMASVKMLEIEVSDLLVAEKE